MPHATLPRLFKNVGVVLTGNAGASMFGLLSLALTARALGPERFGILVLIQSYVAFVQQFTTFCSWPVLITYGAQLLEQNRREDFTRLMKFGIVVDLIGAALGGVGAAAAAYWVGRSRGWDPETIRLTVAYGLTILTAVEGTPKAVLRLFGRFKAFAMQELIASGVKLAGVAAALFLHGSLTMFVGVWMLTTIVGNAVVIAMGWRELHRQGIRGVLRAPVRGISERCPGVWGYIWTTNLNSTMKIVTQEADMFIVGGLLGVRDAGFYKVVKQCSKLISQITDPLQQVLYPEVAKFWAKNARAQIRALLLRISGLSMGVGALVWVGLLFGGHQLLALAFGPEFVGAYLALLWYVAGTILMVGGLPLAISLPATGQYGVALRVHLLGSSLYLPGLWYLIRTSGLVGAAMAHVGYHLFRALVIGRVLRKTLTEPERHAAPGAPSQITAMPDV